MLTKLGHQSELPRSRIAAVLQNWLELPDSQQALRQDAASIDKMMEPKRIRRHRVERSFNLIEIDAGVGRAKAQHARIFKYGAW